MMNEDELDSQRLRGLRWAHLFKKGKAGIAHTLDEGDEVRWTAGDPLNLDEGSGEH